MAKPIRTFWLDPPRYPEVAISDTTVHKRQNCEQTRFELVRTRLGGEIGKDTGLFDVPRIIASNLDTGSITFERISGMVPLRQALAEQAN